MKFSDNITRYSLTPVYIIETARKFETREIYKSLLWREAKHGLSCTENSPNPLNLYRVPAMIIKQGEEIYNENGRPIAYRSDPSRHKPMKVSCYQCKYQSIYRFNSKTYYGEYCSLKSHKRGENARISRHKHFCNQYFPRI